LITILDYGLLQGSYYIIMEWVEGVDVSSYLIDHGPLSPWWAATIARQVCCALEAVHRAGLVHRAVKPQNILFTARGEVKVTDVGMNRLISETGLSRTNVMLGGVGYISPEQARAEPVGPASDIYSLGITLFEMLTGRLPFISTDAWTLVRLHTAGTPPSLRAANPKVPGDLEAVVRRALEKTPERRYASAGEMEAALATVQTSGSLSQSESGSAGVSAGLRGGLASLRWHIPVDALMSMLMIRIPLGFLGLNLPFVLLLFFQFLVSFSLAFMCFYGLILLFK
jgi:serine/threonine-protein kinase